MAFDVGFLAAQTELKLKVLEREAGTVAAGRGSSIRGFVLLKCEQIRAEVQRTLDDSGDGGHQFQANQTKRLERAVAEAALVHQLLATYRADAGRNDVPLGITSFIDSMAADLIPEPVDPIVHLAADDNYLTVDVCALLRTRFEPRIIAFHLPALEPANAFRTPILAHEIAHNLLDQEETHSGGDLLDESLVSKVAEKLREVPGEEHEREVRQFWEWVEELQCDIIALALSGPSYIFAIAQVFAIPGLAEGSTHPPDRYRARAALLTLDHLGWTGFLTENVPDFLTWVSGFADDLPADRSQQETVRIAAMDLVLERVISRTLQNVEDKTFSASFDQARIDEAKHFLECSIPPVELKSGRLTVWEAVLAGWMVAFTRGDNIQDALLREASHNELSELVVKTMELLRIVELWEGQ